MTDPRVTPRWVKRSTRRADTPKTRPSVFRSSRIRFRIYQRRLTKSGRQSRGSHEADDARPTTCGADEGAMHVTISVHRMPDLATSVTDGAPHAWGGY